MKKKWSPRTAAGQITVQLVRRYYLHDVGRDSAALTYYLLFALFPLLVFISTLLGILKLDVDSVTQMLSQIVPADVMSVLESYLEYVSANASRQLLWFSLIFSVWFPMRATSCLLHSLRKAFGLGPPRKMLVNQLGILLFTVWLILRDGITTNDNYDRDSIGEFDYTQGSGWMYSINGTLYEGTGMSGYKVRNGITIYVRFTLSYGKDIGGYDSTGGGYGSLSSYCGLWINGGYQALGHDFVETDRLEPTETEDGYIHYRCSKCHEEKTDILPATGGTEPSPTAAQAAPALLLRRGSGLTPYQNKFHRTWEAAA